MLFKRAGYLQIRNSKEGIALRKKIIYMTVFIFIFLFFQAAYCQAEEIRIAIIDTGISYEVISSDNIIDGKNYIDKSSDTNDIIGHGTAVSGIILGSESVNIKGIAPSVKLVPMVVSTETADGKIVMGNSEILAEAINDAIDIYGCKIINVSMGTLTDSDALRNAVKHAEEKGAVVISSVGNDNKYFPENIYYPAAYETVIGVSALNRKGEIANFSQRNSSVSICAPGDRIKLASLEKGKANFGFGTSYATSYVSAAAALIVEKYPDITPEEIRKMLFESSKDLGETGYDIESGWGSLDLESILK